MSKDIQFHQSIGFSFRYRANITNKVPGQDPKYCDTVEQTLEIEGAGYTGYHDAVLAAGAAKERVIEILHRALKPEPEKQPEPEIKPEIEKQKEETA